MLDILRYLIGGLLFAVAFIGLMGVVVITSLLVLPLTIEPRITLSDGEKYRTIKSVILLILGYVAVFAVGALATIVWPN